MTSKIIECAINSASSIKHNNSNNYWTNYFNQDIELNAGDTINIQLGVINTLLTGEQILEIDSSKGENIGYIKCQFYLRYDIQNMSNDNDNLEFNPILLNPQNTQATPNNFIRSIPNNQFLTNNLTIVLDPNQRYWTPDEIAEEINKQINATYTVNRACVDGAGTSNRTATLNPLQSMIYTTNNGTSFKATQFFPNGDSTNDLTPVTDTTGSLANFLNSAFVVGASAPVFSWNSNNSNKFSFSGLHSPIINYATTSGATNNPTFSISINGTTYIYSLSSSMAVIDLGGLLFSKCGFFTVPLSVINSKGTLATFTTTSFVRPSVNFQGGTVSSQPEWLLSFQPATVPKYFEWNSIFYYAQNSVFTLNEIGYYLLKSDIGTEGNFFSSEGKDELQIVSFLNKNYQSGSFYFCFTQSNPIIITCKKIIKSITLELLNPDLTIPAGLLENSTIFIQILKNVSNQSIL